MPQVTVVVKLKPALLDAQGRVVENALKALGYGNVNQVRIGKYMELDLNETSGAPGESLETQVRQMCDRLLANPVIEEYQFEVQR